MLAGMPNVAREIPQADAYDAVYLLPEHWILHERDPDGMFTRLHAYYIDRVVEIIKRTGAKNVLEVGCGDGWACGRMVQAGLDVTGIDWSANAVAYASIRVPNATFMRADARDKSFRDRFAGKFDAVAFIEVIEHIPPADCVAALDNIATFLRPGGTLVLTTPHVNFPNNNPQHYRHFTAEILKELVSQVPSLSVLDIEGYGDVVAEQRHWKLARWVKNRLYEIKPAYEALQSHYNKSVNHGPTPADRCHGLILTIRRN